MEFLNNMYRDTIQSDQDGKHRGTGFGAFLLKPFVDEQNLESSSQQGEVKRTFTAAGEIPAEYSLGPGATRYDAQGAVVTRQRDRAKTTKEEDHTRSMQPLQLQLKQQAAQSDKQHTATMTQLGNQNAIAMAGLTQSNNQFMAQMADAKDQRAMELQIRREELDRADARDSRNRRRDSIAALTSGLAALGAAFAL